MASATVGAVNGQNGRAMMNNAAILEKKIVGSVRRSTPDSEALASSDDDHEQNPAMSMSLHSVRSLPPQGPPRRPSWLSEVQSSTKQRKFSLGGASYTSSGSQPTTPSGENGPWDGGAGGTRSGNNASSYPLTSQGWQKGGSRLMEVMPSPGSQHEDMRSPTFQHQMSSAGLPFEIPLEPTRKTVRSQSYSAGQLDNISGLENSGSHPSYPRGTKTGLMHRPSRPSMLGDGGRDTLGSLREDDDDLESSNGSDRAYQSHPVGPRPGGVRGSSAMNRAAATSPLQNGGYRFHPRTSMSFPLSPGSDYAVTDDIEENGDSLSEFSRAMARGMVSSTTSSTTNNASIAAAIENRRLEGLKRSQWQSSLGFGTVDEGSQSRRHSFAELPSRTKQSPMGARPELMQPNLYRGYHVGPSGFPSLLDNREAFQRETAAEEPSYFSGAEAQRRHVRDPQTEDYNPFAVPTVFSRPVRILYLVAFKCNRADIYYIPENTGLQVKAGDTVIVEGDRGQDLGTIENVNITMDQAKQMKEEYTQKHFRCLMMFSRLYPHIAHLAGDDQAFAASISGGTNGQNSALGPHMAAASNFSQDANSQFEPEPRPKMIKRVARPDEVHLLREKEGNEAKAKRVCQTKVNDHGLRMEILDAEFQHDYRKLTFFYYAEEYINFNELVTDLFKVYKTRIWMSAINPSTYMAMNPNTTPRPPQFHKPAAQGHAANYLRAQEDYRTALENGKAVSPVDRDGPAARGNREFERVMQMQNPSRMAANDLTPVAPAAEVPAPEDFSRAQYDPRRTNNTFVPSGNQFAAFTHQYGPVATGAGPWPQNGNPAQYQFGFPNNSGPVGNYSVSPAGVMPSVTTNHQAAAFTPCGVVPPHQFAGNGYPLMNSDPDLQKLLNDQFQRFAIDTTRQA